MDDDMGSPILTFSTKTILFVYLFIFGPNFFRVSSIIRVIKIIFHLLFPSSVKLFTRFFVCVVSSAFDSIPPPILGTCALCGTRNRGKLLAGVYVLLLPLQCRGDNPTTNAGSDASTYRRLPSWPLPIRQSQPLRWFWSAKWHHLALGSLVSFSCLLRGVWYNNSFLP